MGWMKWHPNDSILSTWTMIDGMTLEWQNDIWVKEWQSNDKMTFKWLIEWLNDIQMMEWQMNEVFRSKWTRNDGMTMKWWNEIQMTWMTFGWMKLHPNDRMTFKWQNDNQMTEWHSNDGMTHEWGFLGSDLNDMNDLWMNEMAYKW